MGKAINSKINTYPFDKWNSLKAFFSSSPPGGRITNSRRMKNEHFLCGSKSYPNKRREMKWYFSMVCTIPIPKYSVINIFPFFYRKINAEKRLMGSGLSCTVYARHVRLIAFDSLSTFGFNLRTLTVKPFSIFSVFLNWCFLLLPSLWFFCLLSLPHSSVTLLITRHWASLSLASPVDNAVACAKRFRSSFIIGKLSERERRSRWLETRVSRPQRDPTAPMITKSHIV